MSATPQPDRGDVERITRALGWRPDRYRPASGDRGLSAAAARWIVGSGHGSERRSAFVKIGSTELTAAWTRVEYANYRSIQGPFMPDVLGFDDDGERPTLALEDLSEAGWPPPWTDERVAGVLDVFGEIAATAPPEHLGDPLGELDRSADWRAVADEPAPFLALGLCSPSWLENALPALIAAAGTAPLAGTALVHADIRSDNLCFRDGRAIVIDWNHATTANPDLDIAAWLPSLNAEGGPAPETILPEAPGLAAWVAGFFCARAGEPPIADAPHVRPLQVTQSKTALPWAARTLGLPPP